MAFDALEVAIELCSALRRPLEILRQHDSELAKQTKDAANGIALQLAEGRCRAGRDKRHLFRVAFGSAGEVETALRLAQAWGYLDTAQLGQAPALLGRLQAMLWRLCH